MAEMMTTECLMEDKVASLQRALRAINDINRLKIICLLFGGEKCVCHIEEYLGVSQPLVSHHLRVLLQAGLVKVRKSGTWSYYSLEKEAIESLNEDFKAVLGPHRFPEEYPPSEACEESEYPV